MRAVMSRQNRDAPDQAVEHASEPGCESSTRTRSSPFDFTTSFPSRTQMSAALIGSRMSDPGCSNLVFK